MKFRWPNSVFSDPLGCYTCLLLVYFLSSADLYIGAIGALPLPPTVLFVVTFSIPCAFILLSDLLRRKPLSRILSLTKQNAVAIVTFSVVVSVALLLSLLPGANWSSGGKFISFFVFDLLVFLIAMQLPLLPFVKKYFSLAVVLAMLCLMYSIGLDLATPGSFSDSNSRAAGFAGNPNLASLTMNMMCAAALSYRLDRRRFDTFVLLVGGFGVFATLSRSGILTFAMIVVCYSYFVFFRGPGRLKRCLSFLAAAFTVAAVVAVVVPIVVQNAELMSAPRAQARLKMLFGGGGNFVRSEESRLRVVYHALELVNEAPLLGLGTAHSRAWDSGTHNLYLQQWVNNGLVGLSAYLVMLFSILHVFWRRSYPPGQVFMFVVLIGGVFSHNLLDSRCFLLLLGLLASLSVYALSERKEKNHSPGTSQYQELQVYS